MFNEYQQEIERGREVIRKKNITFACFKMLMLALLQPPKRTFSEEEWIDFYNSYARTCAQNFEEVEEWADFFFADWTLDKHSTELRKQPWEKFDPAYPPPIQKGFIICIPMEDNHITSAMWDVSRKWVLLDQYRALKKNQTIYYRPMPKLPDDLK